MTPKRPAINRYETPVPAGPVEHPCLVCGSRINATRGVTLAGVTRWYCWGHVPSVDRGQPS